MKVLHVITGLEAGGAEIQLAMLVRHTRHEPDVLTLYNPGRWPSRSGPTAYGCVTSE